MSRALRSAGCWNRSSIEARKFVDRKLAEARPRSPITAPTSRSWRRLIRCVGIARNAYDLAAHPAVVLPSLVLGAIGAWLYHTYH